MARRKALVSAVVLVALGMAEPAVTNFAQAGMFDMMNPSKWFGGSRDRDYYDRDYYYGRGWGGGPYGWGGGPYGWGGGPYGWGGGPYGWGGGPYGWGGWGYPGAYAYPYAVVPGTATTQQQAPAPAPKVPE